MKEVVGVKTSKVKWYDFAFCMVAIKFIAESQGMPAIESFDNISQNEL